MMDGFGLDDSDGIWDGVSADGSDCVVDYLVAVFRLAVGEQNGVVALVLLYEAVYIDGVVMPQGGLHCIVAHCLQRSHSLRRTRAQKRQSNSHNSHKSRQRAERRTNRVNIHFWFY